ncbi:ty3-gypsy retrotransposon protein [Tanacetum coccineum]
MRKMVDDFVRTCLVCQQTKYSTQVPGGLLQPLLISKAVWEEVSMDFIMGLSMSKEFMVIFVVVNRLTKYAYFGALPTSYNAHRLAELFMDISSISRFPKAHVKIGMAILYELPNVHPSMGQKCDIDRGKPDCSGPIAHQKMQLGKACDDELGFPMLSTSNSDIVDKGIDFSWQGAGCGGVRWRWLEVERGISGCCGVAVVVKVASWSRGSGGGDGGHNMVGGVEVRPRGRMVVKGQEGVCSSGAMGSGSRQENVGLRRRVDMGDRETDIMKRTKTKTKLSTEWKSVKRQSQIKAKKSTKSKSQQKSQTVKVKVNPDKVKSNSRS